MAYALPLVRVDSATVRRISASGDSTDYSVAVGFTNTGALPTALHQARLVKIVPEDRVRVEFDSALTRGASPRVRIVSPPVRDKDVYLGWTEPGESKQATLTVRIYGPGPVRGKLRVLSTRGGAAEREIEFGR